MSNTSIYWLHTLSPTHVGTGRGVGYIDLPIHRDKVTNWPVIPGSAFKGVWRDWAQQAKLQDLDLAFGRASDDDTNTSNSGALIPTDARLVCLPVRSFQGTLAWCTSPLALQFLHRDLTLAGVKQIPLSSRHIIRTGKRDKFSILPRRDQNGMQIVRRPTSPKPPGCQPGGS